LEEERQRQCKPDLSLIIDNIPPRDPYGNLTQLTLSILDNYKSPQFNPALLQEDAFHSLKPASEQHEPAKPVLLGDSYFSFQHSVEDLSPAKENAQQVTLDSTQVREMREQFQQHNPELSSDSSHTEFICKQQSIMAELHQLTSHEQEVDSSLKGFLSSLQLNQDLPLQPDDLPHSEGDQPEGITHEDEEEQVQLTQEQLNSYRAQPLDLNILSNHE